MVPKAPAVKRGISVATRPGQFTRDEWVHVCVTYDGSRKAAGVKIYLNGKPADTEVKLDTLDPRDSIRTGSSGTRAPVSPGREKPGTPGRAGAGGASVWASGNVIRETASAGG